jgi:capsular exopolysaccharide synthesis family protein
MSRLHGALSRATEGKAQILPPDAGISPAQGMDANQSAFTVPWTLDTQTTPDTVETASGKPAGFVSQPARHQIGGNSEVRKKLVGSPSAEGRESLALAAEQYRKIAATLHHAQGSRGMKVVLVTSALPGEGKSLTASNLALTLSESYQRRVLLIDGDLRRPSLHDIFGIPNGAGLSDRLAPAAAEDIGVLEVSDRLSVLPSGRPMEDPTGLIASDQMRRILETARTGYDWVIIDTPPIGLMSDARLLSEMVDGVILVVEAGKTPYPDLLRAVESMGRDRLLGTVLNRLQQKSGGAKYYASYYGRAQAPNA